MNDSQPILLGDQLYLPNVPFSTPQISEDDKVAVWPLAHAWMAAEWRCPLSTEACMERLIKRLKDLPEDGYVIPYSFGPTLISILTTAAWHRSLEAFLKTDGGVGDA